MCVCVCQATEQARITTEAATIACRSFVSRVKEDQQKGLTQSLEDGVRRLEATGDSLAKWKVMHTR